MLDILENQTQWRFCAFGKHPAAKDYFRLGHSSPFVDALCAWVEKGYLALAVQAPAPPDFWSWRFWARGFGRESLVCGVVRLSSDSMGRLYPLLVMGSGPLPAWEERWELLPLACEKTWRQIESVATKTCSDLRQLECVIEGISSPCIDWEELVARRHALTCGASPEHPFTTFLDLDALKKRAAECTAEEAAFSLDHGRSHDKALQLSLWHFLLKESGRAIPTVAFMGGNLERAYLAVFRRALAPGDFLQLWSASGGMLAQSIGMEDAMDLSALGREPVGADHPAGVDVRYDPVFEELQTQLDRTALSSAAGAVDWEKVVRGAAEILSRQSKDLLVAGYLAVGLLHTRGVDGLAIGLKIYRDLLEHHGPSLFPQRHRGRLAAVEWWSEKSAAPLEALEGAAMNAEQLAMMQEDLGKVTQLLREQLPEAPSLQVMRDFLQRAQASELRPEAAAEKPDAAVTEAVQEGLAAQVCAPPVPSPSETVAAAVPVAPNEGTAGGAGEPREAVEQGLQRLREAAALLLHQDVAHPLSYRLSRHAAWLAVSAPPPAENGQTRLPAPPVALAHRFAQLQEAGDGSALVLALEAQVGQFPFWLDLNRMAAEALQAAGHQDASIAVLQETAFLLQRLPGLEDLFFADGTPFADPLTKAWLQKTAPAVAPLPPKADTPHIRGIIEREAAEASALIREGKFIEAIDMLQTHLNSNVSARERLQWRLTLSKVLMEAAQVRFALPHLEQVVQDIDTFGLEGYDPAIALEGLKLAWQGFQSQSEPHFQQKANETLHRIGRIAPVEMIRLASATP